MYIGYVKHNKAGKCLVKPKALKTNETEASPIQDDILFNCFVNCTNDLPSLQENFQESFFLTKNKCPIRQTDKAHQLEIVRQLFCQVVDSYFCFKHLTFISIKFSGFLWQRNKTNNEMKSERCLDITWWNLWGGGGKLQEQLDLKATLWVTFQELLILALQSRSLIGSQLKWKSWNKFCK